MTNARGDAHGAAVALAFERSCTSPSWRSAVEPRLVEVDGARGLGLLRERVIEVRPVPVRVGDLVVRARRDQQLPLAFGVVGERLARAMEEEGEAALQAARDVRSRPLPRAPLRERPDPRQVVAVRQLLEQQVGQRRGRLADGEARVAAAFDQRDAPAALQQRERRQRSAEAGADDGDVGVDAGDAVRASCVRAVLAGGTRGERQHALFEVHRVEAIAPRRDAVRAVREALQIPEIDEHPAAAGACVERQREAALDVVERRARGTMPASASASIAPLPGRVGTSETTAAPQEKAASIERSSQASCSVKGTNGGEISRNTRSATPRSASASAACAKSSSVNRLFSRSSASGCAVSSPIATSSCGAGAIAPR